jgi:hypothetical protein
MKRVLLVSVLFLSLFALASADLCDPTVTLLNQDPYPAVPGDYAKLVFQVEGVSSTACGDVSIELVEKYPITIDPSTPKRINIKAGTYTGTNYESFVMAPYKVRVDESALDGDTPVELIIEREGGTESYEFNINIEDTRADFEVHIKDYNYATRELTLEILNIGDPDIQALTVEIPKQDNIDVKGANRVVVGDLDSNEYTTADFEAVMYDGEITLNLYYSDAINARRTVVEQINFDSSYFIDRVADQKTTSKWTYVFWGVVVLVIIYLIYGRFKKKKNKK